MADIGTFTADCPHCGKRLKVKPQLAGRLVKCTCGKTFTASVTVAAAVESGPAVPVVSKREMAETAIRNDQLKKLVLIGLLVLLVIGAWAAWRVLSGGGKAASPGLGEDATVEELITSEDGTEARLWLDGRKGRMLSGMNESQAEFNVDQWYKLGALKVYAFGGLMSRVVALELPHDVTKRQSLFEWVNKWHTDMQDVPKMKDVGQKYLLVRLKL